MDYRLKTKQGGRAIIAPSEIGHAERLGGVGEQVAHVLGQRTGKDARVAVLLLDACRNSGSALAVSALYGSST